MPLVKIIRDPQIVSREKAIELRNFLNQIVATMCDTKPTEVEVRIQDVGELDIYCKPINIEVDTGSGKGDWRIGKREQIAEGIARTIMDSKILPPEWLGPEGSYVWLRIFYSRFVPIGYPELAK